MKGGAKKWNTTRPGAANIIFIASIYYYSYNIRVVLPDNNILFCTSRSTM